jgi:hypothetical protein
MNHKRQVVLADAICAVRPDWQQAGVIAQLHILAANWTDTDAALAAHVMTVAASRTARTPAAFNATPPARSYADPAPTDKQPRCYICGQAKLDCQKRQDWEITHGVPDPHIFETEADATARKAVRSAADRAELNARIRTLFRRVDDELAKPTREPYLPPDLAAETQARHEADEHQPEQETLDA